MTDLAADLAVRAARAELERDKLREQNKNLGDALHALMSKDEETMLDTLHIIGIPARDLKDIFGVVYEWRRKGGTPQLLELILENHALKQRIAELEAC